MKDAIDTAIEILAKKIDKDIDSNDALKYSQAALNLANTQITMISCANERK